MYIYGVAENLTFMKWTQRVLIFFAPRTPKDRPPPPDFATWWCVGIGPNKTPRRATQRLE